LGIRDCFSFVLSCETIGVGKSRPDIYYAAADRFGASPEETAVYEDALYAAETAKKAGFYLVGVFDESASKNWKTIEKLADEIILNWEEEI
jgi:HAD superfamily hydrolase (TIGR01509 family)